MHQMRRLTVHDACEPTRWAKKSPRLKWGLNLYRRWEIKKVKEEEAIRFSNKVETGGTFDFTPYIK